MVFTIFAGKIIKTKNKNGIRKRFKKQENFGYA